MAHYAKIGKGNIVTKVHVLNNEVLMKDGVENEQQGVEFLQNLHKNRDLYIQTSYNGNFRKNYAGVGYKYDQAKDAFIAPQPYPSWLLDEDTCLWNPPTSKPDDGKSYYWDEDTTSWKEKE
jgi:hypothetical protein|tara:strand:+ start:176 stop:538 length:363 start_codon:yes stop_codon:yes gene_type:complete